MGIAVLSGVIDSLHSASHLTHLRREKWESHTPGTQTPRTDADEEATTPSRFIACVRKEESASKLKALFGELGGLGPHIEVVAKQNLASVQKADVVILS